VDRNIKWILVAPAIFIILALTVFPLVFSIWTSFVQYDFSLGEEHPWVGLDNFRIVWEDPVWRRSLYITGALAAGATLIELVLGLILALAMLRHFRGRRILMVLFVIPLFVSPVIVGMFFDLFLRRPQGPANQIVSWLVPGQTAIDFTFDSPWTYVSILVADAWQWTPFMFVILLAGLTAIPPNLYEAAELDGVNAWQTFWSITVPQLGPMMLLAITFRLLDAIKLFDVIFILTGGGPGTSTYSSSFYLFTIGFTQFHLSMATAGSWIFLLLTLVIITFLVRRLLKPEAA
jgi:multiple sugar transport system permease protein